MPRATSPTSILAALRAASFQDDARMEKARTVLFAMPEAAQLHYAGMMAYLIESIPSRNFGPAAAFNVLVALGDLLERKEENNHVRS